MSEMVERRAVPEMVERVAKELYHRERIAKDVEWLDWDQLLDQWRNDYRIAAYSAIEVMRDPTEAMLDAAADAKTKHNGEWPGGTENEPCALDPSGEEYWRAMIDAALAHK